ncbi:anti-sigma factor family protein [Sedimentisphaera salicampi]|uniref:Putative transmembrane transcriptional regulator (Anti-sigma factor) n=1 Tax=Sedimentisphaera salicampi TaxID=1941349 RepID=A0A1W6LJY3_9BACT|nr:hypothetical protein [Sedimentisphaera salicampi]ARN56053.1 putative transmembrane transcriptional regulator (anti-sigma factor) [Sedimentisphaera salicampi]
MSEIQKLITQYVDGCVSAQQAAELEEIMSRSPEIRRKVREQQKIREILSEAGEFAPSKDMHTLVQNKLAARRKKKRVYLFRTVGSAAALLAFAAVITVIWGSFNINERPKQAPAKIAARSLSVDRITQNPVSPLMNDCMLSCRVVLGGDNSELSKKLLTQILYNRSLLASADSKKGRVRFDSHLQALSLVLSDLSRVSDSNCRLTIKNFSTGDQIVLENAAFNQAAEILNEASWNKALNLAKTFDIQNSFRLPSAETIEPSMGFIEPSIASSKPKKQSNGQGSVSVCIEFKGI